MMVFEIARFTVLEAARRRLLLAAALLSLAFLALFAVGFWFLHDRIAEQMARSGPGARASLGLFAAVMTLLGFYVVNFLAALLALFTSVGTISGEIESGTLHSIVPKPLRRSDVVLGKFVGYALLLGVYVGAMGAGLLLIVGTIAGYSPPDPARALGLMLWEAWLLLALSLLGGSALPTLANGVAVFLLFGLAWIGGLIEAIGGALQSDAMVNLGIATSLLVPNDALWRAASYYLQPVALLAAQSAGPGAGIPFVSSTPPAPAMLLWSAGYLLAALVGAVALFGRRDL